MKSEKELPKDASRRTASLRREKAEVRRKTYVEAAIAACLALVISPFVMPTAVPEPAVLDVPGKYSATLFLSGKVGGYVLVGVIGLALGAGITLLCVKRKKNSE